MQNYSFSVWAYPVVNPANTTSTSILDIGGSGGDQIISFNSNYSVGGSSGWTFVTNNVGFAQNWWSQMSLPALNNWYHLVLTRDNNLFKVYINGVLVNSEVTFGSTPDYSASPLATIGKRSQTAINQYFTGKIDDIAIYNKVLTQLEVDTIYQSISNSIYENSSNSEILSINAHIFDNSLLINSNFSKNIENIKLEITNLLGQILYTKDCIIENNKLSEKIDISDYNSGIYFIRINNGEEFKSKKIFISK